jgi:hypothetical protein
MIYSDEKIKEMMALPEWIIGHEKAEKFFKEMLPHGDQEQLEGMRSIIEASFYAGFTSGVVWEATGDRRTPDERKRDGDQ